MKYLIAVLISLASLDLFAQNSDTLFLISGDTITGQIFSENQYFVKIKTDTGWAFISNSDLIKARKPIENPQFREIPTRTNNKQIQIPPGEYLVIQTNRKLSSRWAKDGELFEARTVQDIVASSGEVLIPRNSPVLGRVKISQSGNAFRRANLQIELLNVEVYGDVIPISTSDQVMILDNFTAERVLGSASTGAILGGIFYNEWLNGALIGAAAGTITSLFVENKNIVIPQNSTLQFMLLDPIEIHLY